MAFITIYFPDKVIAHINVNWLSPVKVRTTLIGGEKKMLVWNDLEADEKIKIYDKGVTSPAVKAVQPAGELPLGRHVGAADRTSGSPDPGTLLFVECIAKDKTPMNDGEAGLRVVRMLEAANDSIAKRGSLVYL